MYPERRDAACAVDAAGRAGAGTRSSTRDKAGTDDRAKWTQSPGAQNTVQYDATVRDLVNFLVYVGEPAATQPQAIGIVVLFVLAVSVVLRLRC